MLKQFALLLLVVGIGFSQPGHAINAVGLEHLIASNEKITIVDIRPNAIYQKSHIRNAINIPSSIIELKRLPPIGRVIVYDAGIDIEILKQAVIALNAKPGIQAEPLKGGFASWSSRHEVIQRDKGLSSSQTRNLTYQKLVKMSAGYDSLILVDLRMGRQQESLAEHFPNIRIYDPIDTTRDDTGNVEVSSYILQTIPKGNNKALILIDDGNGFSEKVADKLHAAGTKRLAILAGGEQSLRVRGETAEAVSSTGD